jgi:hypothetical protein
MSEFTDKQREEIKSVVHEALTEFFKGYSIAGKNIVVTTAVIIGSLLVIFGGIKSVLAFIGFSYMK